jgi:hypothetical protein
MILRNGKFSGKFSTSHHYCVLTSRMSLLAWLPLFLHSSYYFQLYFNFTSVSCYEFRVCVASLTSAQNDWTRTFTYIALNGCVCKLFPCRCFVIDTAKVRQINIITRKAPSRQQCICVYTLSPPLAYRRFWRQVLATVRGSNVQSVPCTQAIFWCIVRPHPSPNHFWQMLAMVANASKHT